MGARARKQVDVTTMDNHARVVQTHHLPMHKMSLNLEFPDRMGRAKKVAAVYRQIIFDIEKKESPRGHSFAHSARLG